MGFDSRRFCDEQNQRRGRPRTDADAGDSWRSRGSYSRGTRLWSRGGLVAVARSSQQRGVGTVGDYMKFVDEYRDPELIIRAADEIRRLAEPGRHYRLMEVCGGHTHAIYRFGLKDLLPDNVELIHGPGCPVCVLPMGRIDDGLSLSQDPNVIFAAFGDMMRVPG